MWTNPRYRELTGAEPPKPFALAPPGEPPKPSGDLVAALPRKRRDGPDEELRVSLDSYQGHPYISVRLWTRDARSGAWWPVKGKGISVRLSEADDVAGALREAAAMADRPGARTAGR